MAWFHKGSVINDIYITLTPYKPWKVKRTIMHAHAVISTAIYCIQHSPRVQVGELATAERKKRVESRDGWESRDRDAQLD